MLEDRNKRRSHRHRTVYEFQAPEQAEQAQEQELATAP